jgi:hypothetical protein
MTTGGRLFVRVKSIGLVHNMLCARGEDDQQVALVRQAQAGMLDKTTLIHEDVI